MKYYKSMLYGGIGSLFLTTGIFMTDTNALAQQHQPVEAITSQMKNASPSVRAKLIEVLSEMGGSTVVAALVDALGDDAPQVRREAADELGRAADRSSVQGLMAALQDQDQSVRREAADALGQIGDPAAAEALAEEGISVEVVNLRSLRPLDRQAIIDTVKKTKRLVTVEEGWPQNGIGAEVAAVVMECAWARVAFALHLRLRCAC